MEIINKKLDLILEKLSNIEKMYNLESFASSGLQRIHGGLVQKVDPLNNGFDNNNILSDINDFGCWKTEGIKGSNGSLESLSGPGYGQAISGPGYGPLLGVNGSYNKKKQEYRELKIENFDLDQEFVKSCLLMNSINGDIRLFKRMYIDDVSKEYYPIRHIKKKFQYWINNHMEDDHTNGKYIKDVIIKNIETCYLKVNMYDNFLDNIEQFMKNQEHIDNITEQKYKDKFLMQITNILNI